MSRGTRISNGTIEWVGPTLMLSSLAAAICLAIGHHAFYRSLQGSQVPGEPMEIGGWKTTAQQVNIAAGTTFAFLVKAALVLATSIAHTQVLFRIMRQEALNLAAIDALWTALTDLPSLFRILTSRRTYPSIALIAISSWLIPLAAIIAPASLTVKFDTVTPPPIKEMRIPVPAFDSLSLAETIYSPERTGNYISYYRCSDPVRHLVQLSLLTGRVLDVTPPVINASWTATTPWPRMVCGDMSTDMRAAFGQNVWDYLNSTKRLTEAGNEATLEDLDYPFTFLAWVDWMDGEDTNTLPYIKNASGTWDLDERTVMAPRMSYRPSTMNIAFYPHDLAYYYEEVIARAGDADKPSQASVFVEAVEGYLSAVELIQCKVVSRLINFRFTFDGQSQTQHVRIESEQAGADLQRPAMEEDWDLELLPSLANLNTSARLAMRKMSYDAIFGAFYTPIVGTLPSNPFYYPSQIGTTSLLNTLQVFNATNMTQPSVVEYIDLNIQNRSYDTDLWSSLGSATERGMRQQRHQLPDLKVALEESFLNATLSIASSPSLLYNSTSPFAPEKVPVTQNLWGNIYQYAAAKLWLAYGIAIAVTCVNVCLGMFTIYTNKATYSANFSTVVRVAKNAGVDLQQVPENALVGRNPLPSAVGRAIVKFPAAEAKIDDKDGSGGHQQGSAVELLLAHK